MQFPTVEGQNLNRQTYTLPDGFEAELNLVVIAYQQWHQTHVDTWVPTLQAIEQGVPGVRYYELPVVPQMGPIRQMMLDGWMRAGIPNPDTRSRTITLYIDQDAFNAALNLDPSMADIHVLVVRPSGEVIAHFEGRHTGEKAAALREAVLAHAVV